MKTANAIATDLLTQWANAFNRADWVALNKLYRSDAQLFGGKPDLYAGSARVLEYFSVLESDLSVSFDEPAVVQANKTVIVLATIARFVRATQPLPYRFSWTLVFSDERWLVAAHHASPKN